MSPGQNGETKSTRVPIRVRRVALGVAALVLTIILFGNGFRFFSNPYTPPGFVGYLTRGALIGHAEFVGLQTGPTSSGLGWMLQVINVPVTPFTFTEEFAGENSVLSADSLKVSFRVHVVWRIRPDGVRPFIERYAMVSSHEAPARIVESAYANFIREPLRTFARDEVQKFKGLDVKDAITPIGEAVTTRIIALTDGTPFEVRSVVVGNIQYPQEVADAVARKLAAVQELERRGTEIEIARRDKEKRIIEAEGVASATGIISQRLTPAYLQYEAIRSQRDILQSPNHSVVYIPVGPMGVPLVGSLNVGPGPAAPSDAAGK